VSYIVLGVGCDLCSLPCECSQKYYGQQKKNEKVISNLYWLATVTMLGYIWTCSDIFVCTFLTFYTTREVAEAGLLGMSLSWILLRHCPVVTWHLKIPKDDARQLYILDIISILCAVFAFNSDLL
jgi:hypothetical protein